MFETSDMSGTCSGELAFLGNMTYMTGMHTVGRYKHTTTCSPAATTAYFKTKYTTLPKMEIKLRLKLFPS